MSWGQRLKSGLNVSAAITVKHFSERNLPLRVVGNLVTDVVLFLCNKTPKNTEDRYPLCYDVEGKQVVYEK
jgi:hypothetical protein